MKEAWTKAMNSLGTSRIDRTLNLNGKLKWSYNFLKSKLFFAMLVFELILLAQPNNYHILQYFTGLTLFHVIIVY